MRARREEAAACPISDGIPRLQHRSGTRKSYVALADLERARKHSHPRRVDLREREAAHVEDLDGSFARRALVSQRDLHPMNIKRAELLLCDSIHDALGVDRSQAVDCGYYCRQGRRRRGSKWQESKRAATSALPARTYDRIAVLRASAYGSGPQGRHARLYHWVKWFGVCCTKVQAFPELDRGSRDIEIPCNQEAPVIGVK